MTKAIWRGFPVFAMALGACAATPGQPSALATPAGQIFCHVQLNGGGTIVTAVATTAANVALAGATKGASVPFAPLVTATGQATQATLDAACTAAAAQVPNATASLGAVPAPAMQVQTVVIPAPTPGTVAAPVAP